MRALPRAFALMGREKDGSRRVRDSQATGIMLLLLAIFVFTLMDATAKHLSARYPAPMIVWMRFVVNAALILLVLGPRLRHHIRSSQPLLQIGRGITQIGSVGLFFSSLTFIGLAEATAIMDINPVLITLGAAVFLGEKIGLRRIIGILVALAGALIIIRPGAGVFHPAAILPLIGAFSYAAGAIMTRMVRGDSTATSILWSTSVGTVLSSIAVPFFWTPIAAGDWWAFIAIGLLGSVAQALLIKAFSMAEAGAVAPFGYTGLIWAGLWGWLFFGTIPDGWTLAGAAIIVAAGIYVWAREAKSMRSE
ncbi:MAG: DMT family transporter [Paracoccus sp. (in: a-proteobacteria)]|uniref:DMT family transporter n=1 Tax=Paracoccus sp. TaxID=267 RepID=UPI0026DEF4EF|nr:DMT family transporter [Paracoccus sp. (in: a-proteobacteria)]MDO5622314.1 DMT family transporter [Paracoccus sp. (in: a-proteobacteria)]